MYWFRELPDVQPDAGTVWLTGEGNGGLGVFPLLNSVTQSLPEDDFFMLESSILSTEEISQ